MILTNNSTRDAIVALIGMWRLPCGDKVPAVFLQASFNVCRKVWQSLRFPLKNDMAMGTTPESLSIKTLL